MDEAGKTGTDIEMGGIQEDFMEEVMFESSLHRVRYTGKRAKAWRRQGCVCVWGAQMTWREIIRCWGGYGVFLLGWGVAPPLEDSSR